MTDKSELKQSQPIIQKQFFCIKRSFLDGKNYKFMYETAIKLNKSYEMYSYTIENYFRAFHQYCSHIKQPNDKKILFLFYFKKYLYDYSKIMGKITDYQISCFQANRQNNNQESLSMALYLIVQDAKKYTPFQKQIRQKKQTLTKEFTAIKTQYMNLVKKLKIPKYYYDKKYMRVNFQPLITKISQNKKGQAQIMSQVIKINENSNVFFNQVDNFRKQLLKNKYKYHKKFIDLATNSKQSLAQLFYYQYNCLNDYYQKIINAMKSQDDQFSTLKTDKNLKNIVSDSSSCVMMIIKNTEDYLNLLLSIQTDLKTTQQNFLMINKRLKQIQQKGFNKSSFQSINKFFQVDESPVPLIMDTLESFDYCFQKIAQKQIDCKKAALQIQNIRKQVTKHKGITLSLLKVKSKNLSDTIRNISGTQQSHDECGVYQFMNILDLKPVMRVVKTCLDSILLTFGQVLNYFNKKSVGNRKLGLSDSMDLSYMDKSLEQIKKKRPYKDELWLWDQYKKKIDTEFTLSKDLFNLITNSLAIFKQDTQEVNLQLQKYKCFSNQLSEAGQLLISKKVIKFSSQFSQRELCIPLSEIQDVTRKTKIVIQDDLIISTKIGQLSFSKFQDSSHVQEVLKETLQTAGVVTGGVAKRIKIQLTDQQRKKIESDARKSQMEKLRPDVSNFQLVLQKKFQSFPIDQFYDLILSDKKFNLTGKQHQCFLTYSMKKYKNKDFKITLYEPPGPRYYTLNEKVTFQNGPLVSQCRFNYKHLLDIPFLPSSCDNDQSHKIFWVSDKQLDFLIHSQTKGVPMSDNFYVELVYKIKQENESTIVKVFAQIVFLKSFALKGTVQSNTWAQIKDGSKNTFNEIQKGINLYKSLISGKTVAVQQQVQTNADDPEKTIQKLRKRNLYMMIAIGVIIILNIIFKIFF